MKANNQKPKTKSKVLIKGIDLLKRLFLLLTPFLMLAALLPISEVKAADSYTVKQYAKDRGLKNPQIFAPGRLRIDGTRMVCGKRPTIYDPTLDDFGGAFDGFIILNPRYLKRLPKQVKLWVYGHECAHQFRGADEATADCFSIKRGVRRGWLNKTGMDQICKFIWSAPASNMHPPGPARCKMMKRCFAEVKKGR
jgi:hypothetical protein